METAQELYSHGVEFQAKGLFDLAVQSYHRALQLDPGNLDVMVNLGAAFLQKGLAEKAGQVLGQVLTQVPDHAMALYNLGKVQMYRDETEAALATFQRAQRVLPDDLDVRRSIGQCLAQLNRVEEARQVFEGLLEPLADDPTVPVELGRLLLEQQQPERALPMLKRAIGIAPDHTEALGLLARVHLAMGAIDKAITAIRRALMANPRQAEFHTMLVDALLEKKDLDGAIGHLKHAVSLDPDSLPLRQKLDELTRRLPVLKKRTAPAGLVGKPSPFEADVYDVLDQLYDGRIGFDHACTSLKSLLERDPTDLFIAAELANLLFQSHRYEEATELYSRIHLAAPNSIEHRINLAKSLALEGEITEAKAFLADSARRYPGVLALPLAQVEILLLQRDYVNARALLEDTLRRQPSDDPHALFLMGYITFRQGNLDVAQATFRKLTKNHPDDEEVALWWSRLMILQNTPGEAVPVWDGFRDGLQSLVEIVTRIELAMAAGDQGPTVPALLEKVRHYEPRFLEDHLLFGKACFYAGDFHAAMEKFQGVLTEDPNHPEALTMLALIWLIRNRTARFWSLWQRACEIDSLYPVLMGLILRRFLAFTQMERLYTETAKIRELIRLPEADKARLQHLLAAIRSAA